MINYIFAFYYPVQAKIFHRLGHLTRYLHALFNTSLSEWGLYLPNSSRFDKCLSKVEVVIGSKNLAHGRQRISLLMQIVAPMP